MNLAAYHYCYYVIHGLSDVLLVRNMFDFFGQMDTHNNIKYKIIHPAYYLVHNFL